MLSFQPLVVVSPKLNTFEDAEHLYADRARSTFSLLTALRNGVTETECSLGMLRTYAEDLRVDGVCSVLIRHAALMYT